MKKILYMMILSALSCACTKNVEIVDPYSQGVRIREILLGATQGRVTVSVETEGLWRVESDQQWLKTDVNGRNGDGAFTVYYESNESDVHAIRQERVAKVAILLENSMKADTLVFVQRGLYPVKASGKVEDDPNAPKDTKKRYSIPYGCFIPVGMKNLLMAGRCISGDHYALSSYRVMPICFAMGEGVGTCAAIALRDGVSPTAFDAERIKEAQELIRKGVMG